MPLSAFLNARREGLNNFRWFCDFYLSSVTGRTKFNKNKVLSVVSKICSVSDEALVIVCMENNHARWSWEMKNDEQRNGEEKPVPPYTETGSKAYKYGGWTERGIARFNELTETIIPALRRSMKKIEKELCEVYISQAEQRSGRRKRKEVSTKMEIIAIMEDTSDAADDSSESDEEGSETNGYEEDDTNYHEIGSKRNSTD